MFLIIYTVRNLITGSMYATSSVKQWDRNDIPFKSPEKKNADRRLFYFVQAVDLHQHQQWRDWEKNIL